MSAPVHRVIPFDPSITPPAPPTTASTAHTGPIAVAGNQTEVRIAASAEASATGASTSFSDASYGGGGDYGTTMEAGSNQIPGNTAGADYQSGYGVGGTARASGTGGLAVFYPNCGSGQAHPHPTRDARAARHRVTLRAARVTLSSPRTKRAGVDSGIAGAVRKERSVSVRLGERAGGA